MDPKQFTDFHRDEYQSLRKEIETSVKEARQLELYVLVLTGVVWTWLAKEGREITIPVFYWIPAVLVLAAIFRSIALLLAIRKIADYLTTVEKAFAQQPPSGWEIFVRSPRDHWIWVSSALFWLILLLATAVGPLFLINALLQNGSATDIAM